MQGGIGHADDVGPSVCFLISINSFGFAYSLVVATLGVVILPSEAVRRLPTTTP